MAFVSIPFTTDAVILADDAVDRLVAAWPDWEPNDGDLEVIQISVLAPMAQEALEVAATVPDAIFRNFGTKLVGLPYQNALPATGLATFEALDSAGYDSAAPVMLLIGDITFQTDTPVVIPPASTTVAGVPITALDVGVAGNELSGSADVVSALPWVLSITVAASTSGGVDAEDDLAYQTRLAEHLGLRAITLVTGRDFEVMATQQDGIGRALAIVGTARAVTVAVLNETGGLASSGAKTALAALYDQYRQVNTTYTVIDPTVHVIAVELEVIVAPGFAPADVKARVEAALNTWLAPMNWGPGIDDRYNRWVLETKVRLNEAIRIASIDGVRYVVAGTVKLGQDGGARTAADLTMTGTVPVTNPAVAHFITATPLA